MLYLILKNGHIRTLTVIVQYQGKDHVTSENIEIVVSFKIIKDDDYVSLHIFSLANTNYSRIDLQAM